MTTIRTQHWRTCLSNRGAITARNRANSLKLSSPASGSATSVRRSAIRAPPIATDALWAAGHTVICCDATRLAASSDVSAVLSVLGREALLRSASLVVSPIEAFDAHAVDAVFRLARLPVPVVLTGTSAWDPNWSDRVPLIAEASRLTVCGTDRAVATRARSACGGHRRRRHRRLSTSSGHARSRRRSRPLRRWPDRRAAHRSTATCVAAARSQNAAGLERLARRVEPAVSWRDIVLPDKALEQLHELTDSGPQPRAGAVGLADAARRRARHRRHRFVCRRLRHRQDDGRRGHRRRPRAGPVYRQPGHGRGQVHRRNREEPRTDIHRSISRKRGAACSTRPTQSSASEAKYATRTIVTRTSKAPICCSEWRHSTVLPCSQRICAPTSTTRSRAGSTWSSTFRCPTKPPGWRCGERCLAPPVPAQKRSWPRLLCPVVRAVRGEHSVRRDHRCVSGRRNGVGNWRQPCHCRDPTGVPQARSAPAHRRRQWERAA